MSNAQNNNGLKTAYTFEGNSNDIVGDNHLSTHGNVTLTSDRFGNENCSYYFPGILLTGSNYTLGDTSAYLYLENPNEDLNVSYSWSLSLWYKGGSTSDGDLEHLFIRSDNPSNYNTVSCYEIDLYDLNTPLISIFKDFPQSENNYIWAEQTDSNLDSSQWHHIALVVEDFNVIKLYVDNVFQDSISDASLFDSCVSKLFIGYNFEGKIDDIFFYHLALSEEQIDSLYTVESTCNNTVSITETNDNSLLINLYPNPAQKVITLESSNESIGSLIEIFSINGSLMHRSYINSTYTEINIQEFPNGLYILNSVSHKNHQNKRIKFSVQ
jgi:hypothetical protein